MKDLRTNPVTVLAATTAVQALLTMGTLVLPSIAPKAAEALNVPSSWIGIQVSALYGAAMVASPFSGQLVRRFGAARMSQASLACLMLGALSVAAASLWTIALGSLLMGVAYGLSSPAAAQVLMRFTPAERRNLMFSLKQTGVPLGGVLAGFIAPPLASFLDWRAPLVLVAVLASLLAALYTLLRSRWDDDRDPAYPMAGAALESLRLLLHTRVIAYLGVVSMVLAAIQLCFISFLVVLLVEEYGFAIIAAGASLATVQVAGVLGRVSWGVTADTVRDGLGTLFAIAAISAILAFTLTALPISAPPWITLAVLSGMGATAIGWNGVFLAEAARLAPAGRVGETTGALLSMSFLGIFIGPASFAAIVPLLGGYRAGFVILAILSAIASVFVVIARRHAHAKPVRD